MRSINLFTLTELTDYRPQTQYSGLVDTDMTDIYDVFVKKHYITQKSISKNIYIRIISKEGCNIRISFSAVDEATKWWHLHNNTSQHKIDPATAEHNHKYSTHSHATHCHLDTPHATQTPTSHSYCAILKMYQIIHKIPFKIVINGVHQWDV